MTESKLPPVAWMYHGIRYDGTQHDWPSFVTRPEYMDAMSEKKGAKVVPLYASSPEVEQMRIEIERLREENLKLRRTNEKLVSNIGGMLIRANNEVARLREALQSIAKSTCCDRCNEAALVARNALKEDGR
jgi:hypothetical protein